MQACPLEGFAFNTARPGGMPEGLGSPFLYKNQYMKDYVLIDEKMGVQWECFGKYYKIFINLGGDLLKKQQKRRGEEYGKDKANVVYNIEELFQGPAC